MGGLSLWHWIIFLMVISAPIPIGKLLQKQGRSWAWALLYFVPILNIIFLWVWAFSNDESPYA